MKARIEMMPLSEIQGALRNPKDHDVPAIKQSLQRFGCILAGILDERTQRLVAGHGRLQALRELREGGEAPPKYVEAVEGEWRVGILRGRSWESDQEAEAFLLADNQLTIRGGWNDRELAESLKRLADEARTAGTGFDRVEIEARLKKLRKNLARRDKYDYAPALPKNPITKPGDLWILGDHRLLCADSRTGEPTLMQGGGAKLLLTDPPYGVGYKGTPTSKPWKAVAGDEGSSEALEQLLEASLSGAGAKVGFIWHAHRSIRSFWKAVTAAGWTVSQEIIWVKNRFVMGRADYQWKHEPALYVKRPGAPRLEERNFTTVWEVARDTEFKSTHHPTQKPVALFQIPIRNHSHEGEVVLDPFCGSGTTIVAAETLERRCYAMEIEPAYCDVAVERWQELTGRKATKGTVA